MKILKLVKQTACYTTGDWKVSMLIEVVIHDYDFDDTKFDYIAFDQFIRKKIEGQRFFPEEISVMMGKVTQELMRKCGVANPTGIIVKVSTKRDDRHMNVISEITL